jgi:hypothetical protein
MHTAPFVTALVIPTGVGASIGGYAGDASQAMALLASVSDILITHPNVANAAVFSALPANAWYVEGHALDQFFKDLWHLTPVKFNRVGLVFDARIATDMLTLHHNVAAAVASVYGLALGPHVVTTDPLQLAMTLTAQGNSTGVLQNPAVLFEACQRLLDTHQVDAIALCTQLPEWDNPADEIAYETGQGVDPIGGLEALLSHAVVEQFQVPCAHAPVFTRAMAEPTYDRLINPKAAPEYIAPTFLPCVLQGLSKAPRYSVVGYHANSLTTGAGALSVKAVDVLIVPSNAVGGIPMQCAIEQGIPLIVVANNTTVLNDTPEAVWGQALCDQLRVAEKLITVASYAEATGIVQAIKLGLRPTLQSGLLSDTNKGN